MRKSVLFLPMILLLLLPGCGEKQGQEHLSIQEFYRGLESCRITGEVICQYPGEERSYTMSCDWRAEGSSVCLLSPEELQGITAYMEGEDLTVRYQGMSLGAGRLGPVAPVQCLPLLPDALREGYITSLGEERLEGTACTRLELDRSMKDGTKLYYSLWLNKENAALLAAEIRAEDAVLFRCRVTEFTYTQLPEKAA